MDGWRCIKRIYFKSRSFWPIGFLTLRYNYIKVCLIQFVFTIHRRVELKFRKCLNIESSIIMSMIQWNTKKNHLLLPFFVVLYFFIHSYFVIIWALNIFWFPIFNFTWRWFFVFVFMFAYDLFCLQWLNMNSVSILIQYYIIQRSIIFNDLIFL